MGVKD
jgi:dynein heavy chain, axonemal